MGVQRKSFIQKYLTFTTLTLVSALGVFFFVLACVDNQAKAKPNFVHKDPPRLGIVAKIAGEEITEEALIGDDKLDFFELKKKEYDLKMDRLQKLLVEKLIGSEAKKAGMSLDDFLNKKITNGPIKISDKDYKKFVSEKKIPEAQITPQIKERITAYLQAQKKEELTDAFVAKLTKNTPVEVYFVKPKLQVNIEVGQSPTFGKADAPVTVVEFSDFQCPFCSRGADTITELKKKYGKKVRFAFKHFPLPMHKDARGASEASMCMNEQSSEKFWKFHDLAFKNQEKLDPPSLEKYAKDSGADMKKYTECFNSKKYKDLVQKDLEYGEKTGVRSTPTFFINGQLVSGAVPIETFSEIIEEELAASKGK